VVALADIDIPEGKRVGELYKIPNVYTDYRKVINRDDIQAVDVCLHNNLHTPATVAALKAGRMFIARNPWQGLTSML